MHGLVPTSPHRQLISVLGVRKAHVPIGRRDTRNIYFIYGRVTQIGQFSGSKDVDRGSSMAAAKLRPCECLVRHCMDIVSLEKHDRSAVRVQPCSTRSFMHGELAPGYTSQYKGLPVTSGRVQCRPADKNVRKRDTERVHVCNSALEPS